MPKLHDSMVRPEQAEATQELVDRMGWLPDLPTLRNVQVGTTDDGKPVVRPQIDRPVYIDPESGAVTWDEASDG